MERICVFCGSRAGIDPDWGDAARALGAAIAARGLELVYGGGSRGMMGTIADAALAGGARVTGVIPRDLFRRELLHEGLTELHAVGSLLERKALMAELSDGFVALPGGIGTLDELFEMWTWSQLGVHAKPCVVLNTKGYYDPLLGFLDAVTAAGYLDAPARAMLRAVDDADAALDALAVSEARL